MHSGRTIYKKRLVVDGNLKTSMEMKVDKVAQWSVNLGELHKITSITVFLRGVVDGKFRDKLGSSKEHIK